MIEKPSKQKKKDFLDVARSKGWQVAIYENLNTPRDYVKFGDERGTDWTNLLPLHKESLVLVIGAEFGNSAVALSKLCKKVYVVESDLEKLAFLEIRKEQQGLSNIFLIETKNLELPFEDEFFDLVFTRRFSKKVLEQIYRILKRGGRLFLSVENLFGPQRILTASFSSSSHSLFGYKNILKKAGFSEIEPYGLLPNDKIPLFSLPLWNSKLLKYFFKNIFFLSEMVSPEAKRSYTAQYKLAKIGVKLMSIFPLFGITKLFFPHFWIIAKKYAT